MRIVFFGSANFAVPALRALHSQHEIAAVYTQPDRASGRGQQLGWTPVKTAAMELQIPIWQPENLDREVAAQLAVYRPEVIIIIAYGALIPANFLPLAPRGWLNLHPSLLPKYRGAAPVPHCILNGDAETGTTIFRINEKFDTGDILATTKIPAPPDATSESLLKQLAEIGAESLMKILRADHWEFLPQNQQPEKSTYARKFTKSDGEINWHNSAAQINRQIRALQPWPMAFTHYGVKKRRLTITKIEITNRRESVPPAVLIVEKNALFVMTGDYLVRLQEVIPEAKQPMSAVQFLRGARLASGEKFTKTSE